MKDEQGLYELLGLQPGASEEEIKAAYKREIRKYHPDFGTEMKNLSKITDEKEREKKKEEIMERCKKINEAKAILLDPEQRASYDTNPSDFFDIFDFFGGRKKEGKRETVVQLVISFEDSYTGKDTEFVIPRKNKCISCDGKGGSGITKCNKCRGTGKIKKESRHGFFVTINEVKCGCSNGEVISNKCKECNGNKCTIEEVKQQVTIPSGTEDGDRFIIKNAGDEVKGVRENIIIKVKVKESEEYFRIKDHLILRKEINLYEVLAGGFINLSFINKKIKVKLSPISDLSKVIRVKGLGFKKGDLFIQPVYKINAVKEGDKVILHKVSDTEDYKEIHNGSYSDLPEEQEEVRSGFFSNFFGI